MPPIEIDEFFQVAKHIGRLETKFRSHAADINHWKVNYFCFRQEFNLATGEAAQLLNKLSIWNIQAAGEVVNTFITSRRDID